MIEISEKDLPITVASKLINATRKFDDNETLAIAINKACGGDGTQDAFSDDELMEIAEHLICYCKHQEQIKEAEKDDC